MRAARRWYIYVMSYAALVATTIAAISLAQSLVAAALGLGLSRQEVATWAGVLVVAFPLFLAHALWANGLATRESEERGAGLRKAYIYATAGLGTLLILIFLQKGLTLALLVLLGQPVSNTALWATRLVNPMIGVLWGGMLTWYARILVRRDRDLGRERGLAATWRRVYTLALGTVGVVLFILAAVRTFQTLLLILLPPVTPSGLRMGQWWPSGLASSMALLLVAAGLWRAGWTLEVRWAGQIPEERATLSRQAFFYLGVALGLGVFLVALAYLLRQGLLGLMGEPLGTRQMWWPRLATALAGLPVGAGVWLTYRARALAETFHRETIWPRLPVVRLYTYVVSGVALAVAWWGLVTLIRVGTRALIAPQGYSLSPYWWRVPLATGLALTLVALPTWLRHWRRIQRVARSATPEGSAERGSLLRRVYLYGVSLVAGLVLLLYLAQVAREVWLWILGEPRVRLLDRLVNASGLAIAAAATWGYHMYVLRGDMVHSPPDAVQAREALLRERERLLRRLAEIDHTLQELEEESEHHGGNSGQSSRSA